MQNLNGTWMMIKTGIDNSPPEFIEFNDDQIIHFELELKSGTELSKVRTEWSEKLFESKYEFVNDNRIRIFRMGNTLKIFSEEESISEETEFATDYERIEPTKTNLTNIEIQKLEFKADWNGEIIPIVFNTDLDSPFIQKINKKLKIEGQKLLLENLQGTYFASIYNQGERRTLIGIKEIDKEKAVLFGFPKEPFRVIANSIDIH
ncbi:hypothetical protein [Maribacter sp. MAR_2009_72]|uniref:hypothetical protein n=1 Tax=Maribacter sp. MAR_2009_72 TaxID=1250050 RepID=UPI00119ADE3C|nr:hypothetical protein [Maribacter sp. MAR_2009_72]TVZ15622.1 hypothetical protein JM81_1872 [Maribacter sp. MAR_2009_72]